MIFISPKGMTVTEWLEEKQRLSVARGGMRKGKAQKRTERGFAKKPLFGFEHAMAFLSLMLLRGRKR